MKAELVKWKRSSGRYLPKKKLTAWVCWNNEPQVVEIALSGDDEEIGVSVYLDVTSLRKELERVR